MAERTEVLALSVVPYFWNLLIRRFRRRFRWRPVVLDVDGA